jgi:condensin complex subunit 1
MAEQVINAIYALAEHPDVLCNDVIKKLTVRAFNRPKKASEEQSEGGEKENEKTIDSEASMGDDHPGDTTITEGDVNMMDATQPLATQAPIQEDDDQNKDLGDAYELAQLLFVVGHVAIKHIVFLELVEREWKRQKDEKQAGLPILCAILCFIPFLTWCSF